MFATALSDITGIGELAVAVVGLILAATFGVPAWRIARAQNHASKTRELATSVAQYLGVPIPEDDNAAVPPPSPEHPSIIDLMRDVRDFASEQAETSSVLAHHMSDGHGGPIPGWHRVARTRAGD